MKRVEQPREEIDGVALLGDLKALFRTENDCLKHLVGTHVGLEVAGIPQFANEFAEALDEYESDVAGRALYTRVIRLI